MMASAIKWRQSAVSLWLAGTLLLCPEVVAAGPLPSSDRAPASRKLHGRFLHITDFHPDEFYKVHSSTAKADICHRAHGPAGFYGAETSDCDAPLALVNATLDWVAAHLKDTVDFVVWTGDSARHDSDDDLPRSRLQILGSNRFLADRFVDTFSDSDRRRLVVPIVPTLGNNDMDPHNILEPGPNIWLRAYTDIWRRMIPVEQRHSFAHGGWFHVDVIPDHLAVFSLNTLYFFDRNTAVFGCSRPDQPGFKQMEWLRVQLRIMRSRGMKALLVGHVPPARTESKQLWDETCWHKYTFWLQQYRDVVIGALYGHMNIDHFFLQDTEQLDLAVLAPAHELAVPPSRRAALPDNMTVASTADYLQELRDDWSSLPSPAALHRDESTERGQSKKKEKKKKKKKKKKSRKGKEDYWGERYQLSLVSPSVVPNYFPTLRVIEYNISGLEEAPVWTNPTDAPDSPQPFEEQPRLELRGMPAFEPVSMGTQLDQGNSGGLEGVRAKHKDTKKAGKKGKHDAPKHRPDFTKPDPPPKTSRPGPAYSPQPLTLTGFTQYYANLTYINNDVMVEHAADDATDDAAADDDDSGMVAQREQSPLGWLLRWRKGTHGRKSPTATKTKPRTFTFEVEYSTLDDDLYNLTDLTVPSFVELAYEMSRKGAQAHAYFASDAYADADADADAIETRKKKKDGKHADNPKWLHFLQHAFVSTVSDEDLEKMA